MNSYQEFIKEIKKVNGPRKHKFTNSYGVVDAYYYYRENKPEDSTYKITKEKYLKVIRNINNCLKEALIQGNSIKLPYRMGAIELQKTKKNVKFKDGKIYNNLPVDWDATLKLWHEDSECKEKKVLIRQDVHYIYKVVYSKVNVKYHNRKYFFFNVNRTIKQALKQQINNNKIEAYMYGKQLY